MARIFISYRRQDSPSMTGRIYDQLESVFGSDRVFRDIDDIGAGQDFRAKIEQEVDQSDVLLVIIGPKWENITDNQGKRRLDNPDDFVRLEVEEGLKNPKKIVIPVLVENTPMPAPESLPKSMRELCYRNAISVRQDPDFHPDVQKLVNEIRKIGKAGASVRKPVVLGAGLLGVGLVAILAASLWIFKAIPPQVPDTFTPSPVNATTTIPDSTISPTSTSSLTPTFTDRPPIVITDTKTATSTATGTSTPSNSIRIGVIKTSDSAFNDTAKRLINLGFEAEWLSVSAGYSDFIKYDIVYLPIGWFSQDETIEKSYSQYQRFVKEGGGLVIEQPNSRSNFVPKLLPYKMIFSPMRYNANEWPSNVQQKHDIVNNLRASELPGPGNKILTKDDHWLVLTASAKTQTPTLVVAQYGGGRIVVLGSAISKSSKVEYQVGDQFIKRFIAWVGNLKSP